MIREDKCIAVLVTHNRPKLFVKLIKSLTNQTYPLKKIIVIDNASDTPVKTLINITKKIHIFRFSKNQGGSGGFAKGITTSLKYKPDWIWIMDDDACPYKNALENIMKVRRKIKETSTIGAFCSSVIEGGKTASYHQKNFNWRIGTTKTINLNKNHTGKSLNIDIASFVGLLINSNAVLDVGVPIKKFFISHDDMEYSLRLRSSNYSIFLVPSSKIKHPNKLEPRLASDFGKRHYLDIRNHLFVVKKYSFIKLIAIIFSLIRSLKILQISKNKFNVQSLRLYFKAIFDGLFKI